MLRAVKPLWVSCRRRTIVRAGLWSVGLYEAETQTTATERNCLARHAHGRKRLVEIGVFNGVTTLLLRQAMHPDGVLWAIDPFPPGRLGFNIDELISRSQVAKSANGTVELIKTTGAAAATWYADRKLPAVDFMFVDGDHSWAGIDADWRGWRPLIGVGGLIALHDSRSWSGREVTLDSARYTAEVIRQDGEFEVIDEVESVTVLRRRNGVGQSCVR
ncbi:MAG TPA: class I SAM-dependent methyltransferase [Lacipirellulaceae bacterium]|nr:class I SAM-dependent methyltransferase [Lacipirellulaceae bacterium]HMP06366.1 class I SAM-dependent methyltransferase [Lacipirellulaceae bacterium]